MNPIRFANDSVELASGFFYNILSLDAPDYRIGKFPLVYYGKKEPFKVVGDSVFFYSTPYKYWKGFRVSCAGENTIILNGKDNTLELDRSTYTDVTYDCIVKYIKVEVDEGPLGTYNVKYMSTYSPNDSLLFEQLDSLANTVSKNRLRLKAGAFSSICSTLSLHLQLLSMVQKFPTNEYDFGRVYLEIALHDGRVIRTEIQNKECSEEIWFALIPLLYGHQKLMYDQFAPIEF